MPNYAIPSPRISPDAYRQSLTGLGDVQRRLFEETPEGAYEYFLNLLSPSFAQDQALRQLYSMLRSRYQSQQALEGPAGTTRWLDFLGSLSPGEELARLPQEMRRERFGQSRFARPGTRYFSF